MSRVPTIPPVSDSAVASVSPWATNSSSTTDSMVWSSTPNTTGPTISRTRASSSASNSATSASSAPLAVMRTLRPSMPLARNARVGPPSASRRSISPASTSARPDSERPHVRSTLERITASAPALWRRSGSTVPSTMARISRGTPGTA